MTHQRLCLSLLFMIAKLDWKFWNFDLCFIVLALKLLGFSNLMIPNSFQDMSSIFCCIIFFVVEVVDTKFCMKQLYLYYVPMPVHWHLLFLVSFVILQCSSLPGEQEIMYSACAKVSVINQGSRSSNYPNNLRKSTSLLEVWFLFLQLFKVSCGKLLDSFIGEKNTSCFL